MLSYQQRVIYWEEKARLHTGREVLFYTIKPYMYYPDWEILLEPYSPNENTMGPNREFI